VERLPDALWIEGECLEPVNSSAFRLNELELYDCMQTLNKKKKFVSSNLSGLYPHRRTLNSRWRKSIFEESGKVVALKCCLVFQAVNTTNSQYLSLGSFMLS